MLFDHRRSGKPEYVSSAPGLLAVYLNDHLAGSVVGVELARRVAKQNSGNEYGREMGEITREIEQDREALVRIMDRLGVRRKRLRLAAAWIGEKLGRLKTNRRLFSYSPLSRLLELEGLVIGITGKLSLWRALDQMNSTDLRLDEERIEELIARAESQRDRVETLRVRAASETLVQD